MLVFFGGDGRCQALLSLLDDLLTLDRPGDGTLFFLRVFVLIDIAANATLRAVEVTAHLTVVARIFEVKL